MVKDLDHEAIEHILELTTFQTAIKGEVLCTQGDEATTLYIIVSGQCSVSRVEDGTGTGTGTGAEGKGFTTTTTTSICNYCNYHYFYCYHFTFTVTVATTTNRDNDT